MRMCFKLVLTTASRLANQIVLWQKLQLQLQYHQHSIDYIKDTETDWSYKPTKNPIKTMKTGNKHESRVSFIYKPFRHKSG